MGDYQDPRRCCWPKPEGDTPQRGPDCSVRDHILLETDLHSLPTSYTPVRSLRTEVGQNVPHKTAPSRPAKAALVRPDVPSSTQGLHTRYPAVLIAYPLLESRRFATFNLSATRRSQPAKEGTGIYQILSGKLKRTGLRYAHEQRHRRHGRLRSHRPAGFDKTNRTCGYVPHGAVETPHFRRPLYIGKV